MTAVGPFSDPAWRLDGVALRLERDDFDVLVSGEIRATVPQVCGRCLEPFGAPVRAAVAVRGIPRRATSDSVGLASDDLDPDFYQNDGLHLSPLDGADAPPAL